MKTKYNDQTKEISNETSNENICIKCNMYSDFKKEDGYNWCINVVKIME